MVSPSTLLTLVNTVLILGTIYLGIHTTIFQKRTSLRESIEQLDSLYVKHRAEYIGVFLHEFNYKPFRTEEATLKFYVRMPTPEEKANVGMIRNAKRTFEEVFNLSPQDLLKFDYVKDVWADSSGFYVLTNTVDSVKCRQLAEEIQIELQLSFTEEEEIST